MNKVYHQSNVENLERAFSVAEHDLGVTRLLDPEGTWTGYLRGSVGAPLGRGSPALTSPVLFPRCGRAPTR